MEPVVNFLRQLPQNAEHFVVNDVFGKLGNSLGSTAMYKDSQGQWHDGTPPPTPTADPFASKGYQKQADGSWYNPQTGAHISDHAPTPTATPQPTVAPTPFPQTPLTAPASIPQNPGWPGLVSMGATMANQAGIPAAGLVGQMAQETGHGTSPDALKKHNYFGYGAYDANPNHAYTFDTPQQSIQAYIHTITTDPRYAQAMKDRQDPVKFIQDVKQAGYASDPDYVAKVTSTPEFRQYYQQVNPKNTMVAGSK